MSSSGSPEQSTCPTPRKISRGNSDASMTSGVVSFAVGSGGESPPRAYLGSTLSPPQVAAVLGAGSSSTPNSPHLARPSSGKQVKTRMRKLLGKGPPPQPSLSPPTTTVHEDSLDASDMQAKKVQAFTRMLKSYKLQPKKRKHFRRHKRRSDKQYHSDDGYTSDPGVITSDPLREEEDDETDDPDEIRRRLGQVTELEDRQLEKVHELERKAEKIRLSLDDDDSVLHENEEELESITDKPQHKLGGFRLPHRSSKSKSFYDSQRQKLEKLEAHIKELQEGGVVDSRGARIRGRIEGGLRGMSLGIKGLGRLTQAGIRRRRKRVVRGQDGDVVLVDEEDEDEDGQGTEVIIAETTPEQEEFEALKVDLAALRLSYEQSLEQSKKWKEEITEHNERMGTSLTIFIDKLEQERERGDRLEGQLNDITELHQHAVDNLHTQLTQIEHTTTSRCQDFEDAVEAFQLKCDNLDAHMQKLLDNSGSHEMPKVNLAFRTSMASLLSFLLMVLAFVLKLTSLIRNKPVVLIPLVLVLAVLLYLVLT